jgi:hypothetical protein
MKRIIAIAFCAATMILASSGASAQSTAKATIPFDFRVGSQLLPSGSYVIDSSHPRALWVRSQDGRASAVVLANTASGSTRAPHQLVFKRYGKEYFLRETRLANGESELTFGPSKLEEKTRSRELSMKDEGQSLVAVK